MQKNILHTVDDIREFMQAQKIPSGIQYSVDELPVESPNGRRLIKVFFWADGFCNDFVFDVRFGIDSYQASEYVKEAIKNLLNATSKPVT